MDKAEEFAYSKYPKDKKGILYDLARNSIIQGYHQAEKDFELTLEDVRGICLIAREVHQFMGFWSNTVYQEVLKRFKAQKRK